MTDLPTFRLTVNETIQVVGSLLATAINLVRERGQEEAYGADPEDLVVLADRIAVAFVQAVDDRDDADHMAAVMTSGIEAYESYRPLSAETGDFDGGDYTDYRDANFENDSFTLPAPESDNSGTYLDY